MSSSPLLRLDLTSEDTLYSTDSIHNQYLSPWLQPGNKNSDSSQSMHINVTSSSPRDQKHLNEKSAPFPYSSSFNYYYNQPAAKTCTTKSLVELHGSSSTDWALEPLISPQLVIKNSTSKEAFDPHIDDFEIVRAKVTGITRVMQKYHIEALDEPISSIVSHHKDDLCYGNNSRPASPLSILSPTTNSLIQSRTESYLQEQQEEEEEENENEDALRRNEFFKLMSNIIGYSEYLESISTELLRTEGRVRELMLLEKQIEEYYDEREKAYIDRLEECHQTSQKQIDLIGHLQELNCDLDIHPDQGKKSKQPLQRKQSMESPSMRASSLLLSSVTTSSTTHSTIYQEQRRQSSEQSWNRSTLLNDLSTEHTKSINKTSPLEDLVHTLRWEVGLRIGGGVGTGQVIHSFEGPLSSIELIIAGSGVMTSSATPPQYNRRQQDESFSVSSSIQRLQFHKHHYVVHINQRDRQTHFRLLPKSAWIPDQLVNQCQFRTCQTSCTTEFNLFQRRHHCRRCGIIICQRHSLNRLPLFSGVSNSTPKWHRVCDGCFYELIIVKTSDNGGAMNDSAADLSELV